MPFDKKRTVKLKSTTKYLAEIHFTKIKKEQESTLMGLYQIIS